MWPLPIHLPTMCIIWRISLAIVRQVSFVMIRKQVWITNIKTYCIRILNVKRLNCTLHGRAIKILWRIKGFVSILSCVLEHCKKYVWVESLFITVWALVSYFSDEVMCKRALFQRDFFHWQGNGQHKFFSPLKCRLLTDDCYLTKSPATPTHK